MKRVLITGGTSDIGASLIDIFIKNNYEVIFTYFSNERCAKEIKEKYQEKVTSYKVDLKNEEEIKEFFLHIPSIDILINNACSYQDNLIKDISKEDFIHTLEVNVVGTFLMCQYALEKLNNGTIINVSSTDSIDTYNEYNLTYATSKAAINMLTKSLSVSTNNRVIAVLLNWVDTSSTRSMNNDYLASELKRVGQKRLLEASEVAESIYKICHNNEYSSGSLVRMDDNDERII